MTSRELRRRARFCRRTMLLSGWGLLAVLMATVSQAAVSRDVQTLRWRRPILLPADAATHWCAFSEDSLLAATSGPAFSDLRVIDADGQVRPLGPEPVVRRRRLLVPWREWPVRWTEDSQGERVMEIDLGPAPPSPLTIQVTGNSSGYPFRAMGRDSTNEPWHFLSIADLPAVDGAPPKPLEIHQVDLGEVRRFLRLEQDRGGPAAAAGDRVRLLERWERWPAQSSVSFHATGERFTGAGRNEWTVTLELTGPARILTSIHLEKPPGRGTGEYIQVEARLPEGGWRPIGTEQRPGRGGVEPGPGAERGQLRPGADGSRPGPGAEDGRPGDDASSLSTTDSLLIEPTRTTALRLKVPGADPPNAPFRVIGITAAPQRWIFRVDQAEPLWVAYGDPYLTVPSATPVAEAFEAEPASVSLGPAEPNPFYDEPGFGLEWLKRRPSIIGFAMVALLALVAWLALARSPEKGARG